MFLPASEHLYVGPQKTRYPVPEWLRSFLNESGKTHLGEAYLGRSKKTVRRVKTQMYASKKGILTVKTCTESFRNFWISDFTIQAFDIMCDILKEISSSDQIFKPPSH